MPAPKRKPTPAPAKPEPTPAPEPRKVIIRVADKPDFKELGSLRVAASMNGNARKSTLTSLYSSDEDGVPDSAPRHRRIREAYSTGASLRRFGMTRKQVGEELRASMREQDKELGNLHDSDEAIEEHHRIVKQSPRKKKHGEGTGRRKRKPLPNAIYAGE